MNTRVLPLALLLLVFTAPALAALPACPNAEALVWLERMSHSTHKLNYHGVVTIQRGEDMEVVQVAHSSVGGTTSESLTRLTGQGAQVLRKEHPLDCVHPGSKLLQLGDSLNHGNCGVAEYYRFKVSEGERVAGREAVRIKVEPRDVYRFGYVMELDKETGLLLKTKILGVGDKTLEKFQFANLTYGEAPEADAKIDVVHQAAHPHPAHEPTGSVQQQQWQVGWLPDGFMATDSASGVSTRRTYTDGLAVFSIFLEALPREIRPGEGVVKRGGTTSYTRGLKLAGKPVLVTVIGEVPVNTARMVADSIAWNNPRVN
jgi:sigma-E factor negative regulatory protein RseB